MHVRLIFLLFVVLAGNVVRGRKLLTEEVEIYEEYRMDPATKTCSRPWKSAALDTLMEELNEAYQFLGMGYTPLQRHKENNDKTMFLEMQAHKKKKSKVDDVADDENAQDSTTSRQTSLGALTWHVSFEYLVDYPHPYPNCGTRRAPCPLIAKCPCTIRENSLACAPLPRQHSVSPNACSKTRSYPRSQQARRRWFESFLKGYSCLCQ